MAVKLLVLISVLLQAKKQTKLTAATLATVEIYCKNSNSIMALNPATVTVPGTSVVASVIPSAVGSDMNASHISALQQLLPQAQTGAVATTGPTDCITNDSNNKFAGSCYW